MAELEDLQGTQKLREAWPIIERNEQAINGDIINHKASGAAHAAESITYSGPVAGAANIKQAVDSHVQSEAAHAAEHIAYAGAVIGAANIKQAVDLEKQRVDTLVINGDSSAAAAEAAIDTEGVNHGTLNNRLGSDYTKLSTQLADTAQRFDGIVSQYLAAVKSFGGSINFIGDSITANFGVGMHEGYTDWFRQKIFDLNGIDDYAVDTVFTGYGLYESPARISGTYSFGTSGPNKHSIILQPGAVWTIQGYDGGDLNYLDVFYNPSLGSLQFRREGVLYRTLLCTGTENNMCSYPSSPTLGPGTYTITCTGSPVEITGLIRLKSTPADRVLHVNRFAKSGTATADYTDQPTLNALAKLGSYTSSTHNLYVIALGTNDITAANTAVSSTVFRSQLRRIAKFLIDQGNYVMLTVPIMSGKTTILEPFENYRNAIYSLAAEFGLVVIDFSIHNFTGLYMDGIHPNADGHKLMYEIIMQTLGSPVNLNGGSSNTFSKREMNEKYGYLKNYWSCSEPSGDILYDQIGGKNGVITGNAPRRTTGTFYNALNFDGGSMLAEIANFALPLNNFTLLFNMVKKGNAGVQYLFSTASASSDSGFGVVKFNADFDLQINTTTFVKLCDMSALRDGDRLAITVSGGFAALYINGVKQTPVAVGTLEQNGPLRFGTTYSSGTLNYYFNGALDEIAFCRVMSDMEIIQVAQAANPLF